jgi:hypothetical protein
MNSEARILELEAKVAELSAFVQQVQQSSGVAPVADVEPQEPKTASRRNMLKLAGAAAAGAAVAVASNAMPAAAADGAPVIASGTAATTQTSRSTTEFVYTNSLPPQVNGVLVGTFAAANLFIARDDRDGVSLGNSSASGYPAASAGYAYRTVANGVYGYTATNGFGVVGSGGGNGSVGLLGRGAAANLELLPGGAAAPARSDAHRVGQVICDEGGDTWICVIAGTPGTFRKIAGATTSGTLHLLPLPKRVYDSRAGEAPDVAPKTPLTNLAPRTIDCTLNSSGVPVNASGVLLNVTALPVTANGFLGVTPGGTGFTGTSTLNWTSAGAIVANSATTACSAGAKIDVTAGGGGTTNVLVDVFGYYL